MTQNFIVSFALRLSLFAVASMVLPAGIQPFTQLVFSATTNQMVDDTESSTASVAEIQATSNVSSPNYITTTTANRQPTSALNYTAQTRTINVTSANISRPTSATAVTIVENVVTCQLACRISVSVIGGLIVLTIICACSLVVCKRSKSCCFAEEGGTSPRPVYTSAIVENYYKTGSAIPQSSQQQSQQQSQPNKKKQTQESASAIIVTSFNPVEEEDSSEIYANNMEQDDEVYTNAVEWQHIANEPRNLTPNKGGIKLGGIRPVTLMPTRALAVPTLPDESTQQRESYDSFEDDYVNYEHS